MIFDTLENLELYIPVLPALKTIAGAMDHDDVYDLPCGKYTTPDPNVTYEISEYTAAAVDRPYEFHKNHTTVEIDLGGNELVSSSWRELKDQAQAFDSKKDVGFFTGEPLSVFQAAQGRFLVFFPGEAFKSGIAASDREKVKKVVFSVFEK